MRLALGVREAEGALEQVGERELLPLDVDGARVAQEIASPGGSGGWSPRRGSRGASSWSSREMAGLRSPATALAMMASGFRTSWAMTAASSPTTASCSFLTSSSCAARSSSYDRRSSRVRVRSSRVRRSSSRCDRGVAGARRRRDADDERGEPGVDEVARRERAGGDAEVVDGRREQHGRRRPRRRAPRAVPGEVRARDETQHRRRGDDRHEVRRDAEQARAGRCGARRRRARPGARGARDGARRVVQQRRAGRAPRRRRRARRAPPSAANARACRRGRPSAKCTEQRQQRDEPEPRRPVGGERRRRRSVARAASSRADRVVAPRRRRAAPRRRSSRSAGRRTNVTAKSSAAQQLDARPSPRGRVASRSTRRS